MNNNLEKEEFLNNLFAKKEIENENTKKIMAEKLINKEINLNNLKNEEIEEMTQYFIQDIKNIDKELIKIKRNIQKMKQQM